MARMGRAPRMATPEVLCPPCRAVSFLGEPGRAGLRGCRRPLRSAAERFEHRLADALSLVLARGSHQGNAVVVEQLFEIMSAEALVRDQQHADVFGHGGRPVQRVPPFVVDFYVRSPMRASELLATHQLTSPTLCAPRHRIHSSRPPMPVIERPVKPRPVRPRSVTVSRSHDVRGGDLRPAQPRALMPPRREPDAGRALGNPRAAASGPAGRPGARRRRGSAARR